MEVKGKARALFFFAAGFLTSVTAFSSAVAFALASLVADALAEVVFFAALAVWVIVDWLVSTRPGASPITVFPAGACLIEKKEKFNNEL
jgi:hypothetical protein